MWGKLGQMQKTHDTHTALVTMNPKAQIDHPVFVHTSPATLSLLEKYSSFKIYYVVILLLSHLLTIKE